MYDRNSSRALPWESDLDLSALLLTSCVFLSQLLALSEPGLFHLLHRLPLFLRVKVHSTLVLEVTFVEVGPLAAGLLVVLERQIPGPLRKCPDPEPAGRSCICTFNKFTSSTLT